MLSFNIFELIEKLFKILFIPFEYIRGTVAKGENGWWYSNLFSFFAIFVLICILGWWISQAIKFKKQGKEDNA